MDIYVTVMLGISIFFISAFSVAGELTKDIIKAYDKGTLKLITEAQYKKYTIFYRVAITLAILSLFVFILILFNFRDIALVDLNTAAAVALFVCYCIGALVGNTVFNVVQKRVE